ncbi:MAG: chloride channel protein [Bacteroidales bacterium]|nr:chloride channel protein [Bacteroidales bacterium]
MKLPYIKFSESTKLLLLSLLVGLCAGASAVVLLKVIGFIHGLIRGGHFLFPAVGMLISLVLVRYVIKDNIGHGVTKVLLAVSRNESRIKPHNMWSSLLTSAITIGLGGSVGAEAPIVYTGAAFGSNIGRAAKLSYRGVTVLLGCGAAGAIAGIFKAPLAGVLFTLEILLFNISMTSIMPLLISTLTATVVSYVFMGPQSPFACSLAPFNMGNLPFYLLLGVFCGLMSQYFTKFTLWLEDHLGKTFRSPWLRWLVCGAGLTLLIWLFPPLFGEGYDSVGELLNGGDLGMKSSWGVPVFLLLILLLKVVSMTLTNSGGGVGGTFGPTLFEGAILGFLIARTVNLCGLSLPEQNFALVGMAGLMAGVMQAPMTAIFLIAEITGGYELLLPLILCATVSYGVTRIRERYSIYTKRIAQSGDLLTHSSDQAALALLKTADLIRDKYPRLRADDNLQDVSSVISDSTVAVFPVLDSDGHFEGVLEMDDIRKHVFDAERFARLRVRDLMHAPADFIYEDERMESVMRKFERPEVWRLPVLTHEGVYLGFISRSRLLAAYREELKQITAED